MRCSRCGPPPPARSCGGPGPGTAGCGARRRRAAARGQVTAFVALLALDERRVAARRLDAAPCLRLPAAYFGADPAAPAAAPPAEPLAAAPPPGPADNAADDEASAAKSPGEPSGRPDARASSAAAADGAAVDAEPGASGRSAQLSGMERGAGPAGTSDAPDDGSTAERGAAGGKPVARQSAAGASGARGPAGAGPARRPARGLSSALQGFMARRYAPWLLRPAVRAGVLGVFLAGLLASLAALPHISKCVAPAAPPLRRAQLQILEKSADLPPGRLCEPVCLGTWRGCGPCVEEADEALPGQPAEQRACVTARGLAAKTGSEALCVGLVRPGPLTHRGPTGRPRAGAWSSRWRCRATATCSPTTRTCLGRCAWARRCCWSCAGSTCRRARPTWTPSAPLPAAATTRCSTGCAP